MGTITKSCGDKRDATYTILSSTYNSDNDINNTKDIRGSRHKGGRWPRPREVLGDPDFNAMLDMMDE